MRFSTLVASVAATMLAAPVALAGSVDNHRALMKRMSSDVIVKRDARSTWYDITVGEYVTLSATSFYFLTSTALCLGLPAAAGTNRLTMLSQ
jgi:hypothetical protein